MFNQIFWQDRVTQYKDRYRESQNPDGTYTHTRVEGEVIQQGTAHNQNNMNSLGFGIQDAHIVAALSLFQILQIQHQSEYDPEDSDNRVAQNILTWGNLQQYRESTQDWAAEVTDARNAAAVTAFGRMQEQRLNEERFDLIASEALGESHTVTLSNTQKFPFNSTVDSPVTVALDTRRRNLFYTVEPEIVENAGPVGEIRVTGKQLNGFKVSFDGCGSAVTVILRIKGGMSHG